MPKGKLELTWVGKDERPRPEPRVLILESSYGAPSAENMLIFGDNFLALKALEQDFTGRIKCIFIDPPYNTGSAFDHYDDGIEHSLWLSMMRSRLELLWGLLRDDGSLWITIDDNEMPYLRVLLDEICGRGKFVAQAVWQKRYSRDNNSAIGDVHDYVVCYARNPDKFKSARNRIAPEGKTKSAYRNPNNDPRGPWRLIPMNGAGLRPNQQYPVKTPSGKTVYPPQGRHWSILEPQFLELVAAGKVYFGKKGDSQPGLIRYFSEIDGLVPWTWWPHEEVGHNDEAKKEIQVLFGKDNVFDTPKPERLAQRIIHIASNPGDWVLDSFAGSGTTGAVAHKMGRRWVMIERGEHCHTHILPRMEKVTSGEDSGGISASVDWKGGGGFGLFRLAETLLVRDKELSTPGRPVYVINPRYDERMLIRAICKIEGFRYRNEGRLHGISSEGRFLHVTTQLLTQQVLDSLSEDISGAQSLLIYSTRRSTALTIPANLEIKRIPRDLLLKCDFGEES